jgi:MoxR-like ATPase
MNPTFNPRTARSVRAKSAQILNKSWLKNSVRGFLAVSIAISVYLWIQESSGVWLVLGIASALAVISEWQRGDLAHIAYEKGASADGALEVEKLLEPSTLANLRTAQPSSYDIWVALGDSEEKFFFQSRFLINDSLFEHQLDRSPGSGTKIWATAYAFREKYALPGMTNASLYASLILNIPNIEQILHQIELDPRDIETAVAWMRDITAKRDLVRQRHNFGGIGRDWAYGYTPILSWLGHNISAEIQGYGFFLDTQAHQAVVTQMIQIMSNNASTVTLVGDPGVGKTTCVHAFAAQILEDGTLPDNLRYHQVVQLDAPTLIANAKNHGQLEELMLRLLREAQKAKNILLFFDDAEVFFGQRESGVDLSHILLPILESGGVRIIMAMGPSAWQQMSSGGIAAQLKPITVTPADESTTLAVLRDAISTLEFRHHVVYTYQSLREAYKLGSRYGTSQAMPGSALSVLDQAATATQQQLITKEVVQESIEQAYGIKLQKAEGSESAKLLDLETELHKYVIHQDRAVTVVSDALRRARSGVGNPNRPVGTFLFLGPTGVGKTELSKALARVYFGDEAAIVRVDMNQYVAPEDVSRLIQPMFGNELGFLGHVRKQPFSVVLLDEIEKAHESVVNALLQMLDEGIMKDSDDKPVSFKDAIIIATSNAGADEIRRLIDAGENIEKAESLFVETLIERGLFKPELINRFDEVVVFAPLDQADLIKVIDLIIGEINKTLDAQKVHVDLTDQAKHWLVEKGYDSKLGARPIRRMAQRYVENIIAKKLLDTSLGSGGSITLDVSDFEAVETK